jgi:diacylglycerol O-acyltransferase / wax synthase
MPRQRLVNLLISNLPGPPQPLYLAGARVLELFQVGVVQGNLTMQVGVLSYAGQLNFAILGDADALPDLNTFADGVSDALTQLGAPPTAGTQHEGTKPPVCRADPPERPDQHNPPPSAGRLGRSTR